MTLIMQVMSNSDIVLFLDMDLNCHCTVIMFIIGNQHLILISTKVFPIVYIF